jgi:hypothetical protein
MDTSKVCIGFRRSTRRVRIRVDMADVDQRHCG